MTQTLEEYLEQINFDKLLCSECKIFLGYFSLDYNYVLCSDCMKKDYEENKQ